MLKDLQKSVEEEELVWKAKIAEAEEQRQAVRVFFWSLFCVLPLINTIYFNKIHCSFFLQALDQVKVLEEAHEAMTTDGENTDQVEAHLFLP